MADDKETSTSSTAPSNPDVNPALSTLLKGMQSKYNAGEAAGNPAAMNAGWASRTAAASGPTYSTGVDNATAELADIAGGKRFGMNDPGYATMRAGALDDAMTGVGSSFLTDGRFGSSVMGDAAGTAATQTLAGLDYANLQNDQQRQMQAIAAQPANFAARQLPGQTLTQIGEEQRAAPWWNLGQGSSVLAGTAGTGGSTSTMTQPGTPWWQTAAGLGIAGAGAFF